jgi:long-chain fatty acid transport protein
VTLSFEWDRVKYTAVSDEPDRIDDGDELHLGVEYARLQAVPVIAFRAGIWLDPDHSIRGPRDNPLLSAFFPRGHDELHYTAGLGVAVERLQVDLGIDLSELSDTASLSAIYRF